MAKHPNRKNPSTTTDIKPVDVNEARVRSAEAVAKHQASTEARVQVIKTVVPWFAMVLIAVCATVMVGLLAGKTTMANIVAQVDIAASISIAVAIGTTGWALAERRLRRNHVERTGKRIQELEAALDPDRQTSGLTPRGETHPGDR